MRIPLRQAPSGGGRSGPFPRGRAAAAAREGFAGLGRTADTSAGWSGNSRADASGADPAELEDRILGLTRRSSRLRFLRAGLARMFLVRKSWTRLGFVRLGDYSRERLGLAARTLEEEAHVAWALERLPRTATAFLESELSWTRVRLIASVACARTEESWIETARRCDTRSLERRVREGHPSSLARGVADDPASAAPPADEDEGTVRFSVRVSREGRRLWRVACEMAERSAGSVLSQAQVLEHVVAEAASGAPLPQRGQAPPRSRGAGSAVEGEEAPGPEIRPHEDDAGSTGVTTPGRKCADRPSFTGEAACDPANFRDHDPELAAFLESLRNDEAEDAEDRGGAPAREAERESLADRIARHLDDIARAEGLLSTVPRRRGSSPDERLEALFDSCKSRDPFVLDQRMREIGLAMQRLDADIGRALNAVLASRLHRSLGFRTFADFVTDRFGFCPRKGWTLVAVERAASRHCPEFADAYRSGRLSLLAARALLPVMGSRHGHDWIERAGLVTLRRLEAEVAWALDRRDAAGADAAFDAPPPPPLDHDLRADAAPTFDKGELQMRAHGVGGGGGDADADADADADTAMPGAGRVQMRAPVDLHFYVAREVAALAEDTLLALRRGSEPRGAAFERMLAAVLLEWTSAPGHRDPVFERDGWRCAVPACSSRRNLHDHHILFRSLGGDNGRDNRVTVCAAHHLHGLHSGRVRARGRAPSEIRWELGCRPGAARPLARLFGDRYLDGR